MMELGDKPAKLTSEQTFASPQYWDEEYAALTPQSEPCEWYESYPHFRKALLGHFAVIALRKYGGITTNTYDQVASVWHKGPKLSEPDDATMAQIRTLRILIIGCGNSRLGEDLIDVDKFESVMCLDFSTNVIKHMQARYPAKPQLRYILGDATDMRGLFADSSFDVVVDKGTFDALLCHPRVVPMVEALLGEIGRVTGQRGLYLCISQSNQRAFYFEEYYGGRAQVHLESWAKSEDSPMGHLNPVPIFHLYAIYLLEQRVH